MKQSYYVKLELATELANQLIRNMVIFLLFAGFVISVTNTVWLIRILEVKGAPLEIGIPVIATISTISIFVVFFVIRQCEFIHAQSISFVEELQLEAATCIRMMVKTGQIRSERRAAFVVYRRSFRRKPVAIKAGIFFVLEPGLGVNYLSLIVENVVSLMLLVDTRYPLTLILMEGVGWQWAPPVVCRGQGL